MGANWAETKGFTPNLDQLADTGAYIVIIARASCFHNTEFRSYLLTSGCKGERLRCALSTLVHLLHADVPSIAMNAMPSPSPPPAAGVIRHCTASSEPCPPNNGRRRWHGSIRGRWRPGRQRRPRHTLHNSIPCYPIRLKFSYLMDKVLHRRL